MLVIAMRLGGLPQTSGGTAPSPFVQGAASLDGFDAAFPNPSSSTRTACKTIIRSIPFLVLSLLLSGCLLPHEADMLRMGKALDQKIAKLDDREKVLQQKIAEVERQAKEAERLVSEARLRLRQDIAEVRDESLPILHGKLEETAHYLKRNREHLDNLDHRIETLTQKVDALMEEQDRAIAAAILIRQQELQKGTSGIVTDPIQEEDIELEDKGETTEEGIGTFPDIQLPKVDTSPGEESKPADP